ncbi:uncharacterized protein J3R85_015120 [Psidium guajava]|nr:uncharacterized protein J3R85_015120 [Psidium guajava]
MFFFFFQLKPTPPLLSVTAITSFSPAGLLQRYYCSLLSFLAILLRRFSTSSSSAAAASSS